MGLGFKVLTFTGSIYRGFRMAYTVESLASSGFRVSGLWLYCEAPCIQSRDVWILRVLT